jgi:PAS domain S-box-containing protein
MSIRLKLTIIILALVSIPLIFVSVISFSNYEHSLETARLSQLENLADFKADRVEAYFAGLKTQIEMSQSYYIIRKHLPLLIRTGNGRSDPSVIAARKVLDGQLRGIQTSAGLFDIMLADDKGRIVYASDSGNTATAMFTALPKVQLTSFKEGLNRISFSEIFLNEPAGNRPEMLISAPAFDLNDAVIGFIVFEMDMAPLYDIIQDTTGLGKTGEILIGKKFSTNEIRYLNPLRHDPGAALKRSVTIGTKIALPIQMAVRGETGIGRSIDYRGNEVVAAWRYIPSLKWGLVAKIDSAEAFEIVANLRRLLIMVLVVVFAMVSIITLSMARSISQPIQMLSKGAEIIGSGNLDYKVGTTLKDEIGRLSRSFDKMTHDLKDTTASRDELNREIAGRKAAEREREISIEFLQLVNGSTRLDGMITSAVSFFKEKSGFEAVGIRLKKGDDYPYFETKGFPGEFVTAETHLCGRDGEGRPVRDADGYPIMECMCGNVIQERFDPSRIFFTKRGSFWSNGTTELLATSTEADRQARTRNRCNGEGYESVGLFALRAGGETLGLLQLNDRRKGMFSPASLALWERLSDYLAVAVSKFLAEEALRESEEGLKRAQAISHLGNWELNVPDNRLMWSDEVYRIFGLKPQEFNATYEAFLEAVHPDDRAAVNEAYSGSLRDGKDTYEIEHRVARKGSGEIRIVHEKCEHFRDKEGKIVRSVGMVQDITERKTAEEALHESEERFRVIAEASPIQISVGREEDGTILFTNPEYDRAFGFARKALIGHKTPELYAEPDERDLVISRLRERSSLSNYEIRVKKSDGTLFWVALSINRIRYAGGDALLASSIDITERKKIEEALRLRTEELKAGNEELTFFNRAMVDREERMIELKKQVNELRGASGLPPLYDLDFGEKRQ